MENDCSCIRRGDLEGLRQAHAATFRIGVPHIQELEEISTRMNVVAKGVCSVTSGTTDVFRWKIGEQRSSSEQMMVPEDGIEPSRAVKPTGF